jgi:hypothetical protein
MTDRSLNRTSARVGHRYAPRHVAHHSSNEVKVTVVSEQSTPVAIGQPAAKVPKREHVVSTVKPAHPRQSRSLVLKRKGLGGPAITPVVMPTPLSIESKVEQPKHRRTRVHPVVASVHPGLILVGSTIVAAVLVFGGGLLLFRSKGGASDKYSFEQSTGTTATLGATTHTSANEVPPSAAEIVGYKTAAESPRLLTIPKISLSSRIVGMSAGKDGLPTSLQNIFDTSWLLGSAKPGDDGVMLISGKAVGDTKIGAFGSLNSLALGDVVQVERGDGKVVSYKVAKLTRYDPSQLTRSTLLAPATPGKPGLNLVTSNSRFVTKTNSFEQRLLVQAVQQ